jgi:hypothetical protein
MNLATAYAAHWRSERSYEYGRSARRRWSLRVPPDSRIWGEPACSRPQTGRVGGQPASSPPARPPVPLGCAPGMAAAETNPAGARPRSAVSPARFPPCRRRGPARPPSARWTEPPPAGRPHPAGRLRRPHATATGRSAGDQPAPPPSPRPPHPNRRSPGPAPGQPRVARPDLEAGGGEQVDHERRRAHGGRFRRTPAVRPIPGRTDYIFGTRSVQVMRNRTIYTACLRASATIRCRTSVSTLDGRIRLPARRRSMGTAVTG